MEMKCLQEEFVILKTAIEEAIRKGQKSTGSPGDIQRSDVVTPEDSPFICIHAGSGVVGWVDDF